MEVTRQFQEDLKHLEGLAFSHSRKYSKLIKGFHSLRAVIDKHTHAKEIWDVYGWLISPLSLWPFDLGIFAEKILNSIQRRQRLTTNEALILSFIAKPPDREQVKAIVDFEHHIERGAYENILRQDEKHEQIQTTLLADPALAETWEKLKSAFDVSKFQNKRGIIRRTFCGERNFKPAWPGGIGSTADQFQAAFDAMCHRWQLWGMEHDKPLPLKLTVHPTPHGIMIMIPRLWSFDVRRDLKWKKVQELHHAYGAHRQGPKLSKAQVAKAEEAKAVVAFWNEASASGLKGEAKMEYVMKRMKRDLRSDPSWVKRRLKEGRSLLKMLLNPPSMSRI